MSKTAEQREHDRHKVVGVYCATFGRYPAGWTGEDARRVRGAWCRLIDRYSAEDLIHAMERYHARSTDGRQLAPGTGALQGELVAMKVGSRPATKPPLTVRPEDGPPACREEIERILAEFRARWRDTAGGDG